MGWQLAASLNGLIAVCYVMIATLIAQGLVRTGQLTSNPLAIATAAIFTTCAMHHGHHASHLVLTYSGDQGELLAVRQAFGTWHTIVVDLLGAIVAATYLGLRRNYRALLHTPAMFDDAVRAAAEARLRELAFTDSLTGIPNRTAYQALADSLEGRDCEVAVLFLDLDGFKCVNDRYGHDVGDRVLRDLARSLESAMGTDERVFRLGGDELIVVGTGHDTRAARALVERCAAAISRPVPVRGGTITVEASIGLATGRADEGVDGLLREADQAMYIVKAGRSRNGLPTQRAGAAR